MKNQINLVRIWQFARKWLFWLRTVPRVVSLRQPYCWRSWCSVIIHYKSRFGHSYSYTEAVVSNYVSFLTNRHLHGGTMGSRASFATHNGFGTGANRKATASCFVQPRSGEKTHLGWILLFPCPTGIFLFTCGSFVLFFPANIWRNHSTTTASTDLGTSYLERS